MNIDQLKIIKLLIRKYNQRDIARKTRFSLGKVNYIVKSLRKNNFLDIDFKITKNGLNYLDSHHPQKAVILAAGYGMRMVPINTEEPKGLLEVKGEPLIERLIKQLHEIGVKDIKIVVGFMKEHYEYLIDKYHIRLVVNPNYDKWNNIYSLYLVRNDLVNSYVIPCDVWFQENPFSELEDPSWYLFSDELVSGSHWKVNNRHRVNFSEQNGNKMIGIAYLDKKTAEIVSARLTDFIKNKKYDSFWEDTLEQNHKFLLNGIVVPAEKHAEINSYEQLLDIDSDSSHLKSKAIEVIEKGLNVSKEQIHNIKTLKKGMTNRSFAFTVRNKRYIMRIPGEGTDELINREHEYDVYQKIKSESYTENVLYLNPHNGYKLSEFIENTHNSSSFDDFEVTKCMTLLRSFHKQAFKVKHTFQIWQQIEFYESLRHEDSAYRDYEITKKHVLQLKSFVAKHIQRWCLCHIDANADNFLIDKNGKTFLIDWEYAGMQDPDLDIAMYAIYAMYDQAQIDKLINIYYLNKCPVDIRFKIYAYVAIGGLLWSNWCEYKQSLGFDFGAYSLAQYRYAKEYSKLVLNYINKNKE